ncbi:acyltransferase [Brevibacterium sp. UMB1308A]|uniref:acyltransferase family protein n=1 Tax=Brevibacterium sp. UMB1308A TaxID=3050608 RepID=UPI002551611A|nr:acyltransferase [Brevibacterium sp. UMB1308A]MDK8347347.1 acyltransferase [Brevibacterium sp. UMB1308B]MDK8712557.1 acyltransferase [Brevibacterium sp. UMB1308A]
MRKFRPEIQLLRAIAVLAVVVYHIQPSWLPGGFVGVDVFFVISGYLITAHMLKEVESTGRLSLSQFWANRARRILPAATLAIVVTSIVSLFVLPSTQLVDATKQGIASALYIQNFLLADQSVDYLGQDAAPSPFQHFWSLSVEEQFYVVLRLPSLSGHPISADLVSVGKDVHCESTAQEVHSGVSA